MDKEDENWSNKINFYLLLHQPIFDLIELIKQKKSWQILTLIDHSNKKQSSLIKNPPF